METPRQPPQAQTLFPVLACHATTRKQHPCSNIDCVRFSFVRNGTILAQVREEARVFPVSTGTSLLVAPGIDFGYRPEGAAELTTLLIDTDYLIEHLFWQHRDLIPDREAARDLDAKLYPHPVQVLRLGERQTERLGPMLDAPVARTGDDQSSQGYCRTHALLFTVLAVLAPLIRYASVAVPPLASRQRADSIVPPRWRAFQPVRREIARTATLMQNDIPRRCSLAELAAKLAALL